MPRHRGDVVVCAGCFGRGLARPFNHLIEQANEPSGVGVAPIGEQVGKEVRHATLHLLAHGVKLGRRVDPLDTSILRVAAAFEEAGFDQARDALADGAFAESEDFRQAMLGQRAIRDERLDEVHVLERECRRQFLACFVMDDVGEGANADQEVSNQRVVHGDASHDPYIVSP